MRTRRWHRRSAPALLACLGVLFGAHAVQAQGFMVRPMMANVAGQPGQRIRVAITVTNTKPTGPQTLRARVQMLGQSPIGAWRIIDPNDAEGTKSAGRTCYEWAGVEPESVTVDPMMQGEFGVTFRVPVRAAGAYAVAVVVNSTAPAHTGGIGIVFQFLIPIIVRVQGPVAPQAVHVGAPVLVDVPATAKNPATTAFFLGITNSGDTYETVGASANILLESKGKWRKVSGIEVPDHGLLPGLTIQAPADLGKRLPGGKYRIQGSLRLDGATKERFDKVVEFAGDPSVKDVAYDVDLLLQPASLSVVSQPGARRSAMLTVENPSPEAVHIRCGAELPRSLTGVMLDDLKGEMLSAVQWLKLTPADFQLPAGGRRTVRVDVAWPADEDKLPVHYANVVVLAGYDTGGSAGRFVVPLSVRAANAKPQPKAAASGIDIASTEPNKCAVSARFHNVGLAEWSATAAVSLGEAGGRQLFESVGDVDTPVLLPLGQLQVSGVMDLSTVPPGTYALTVTISFAGTTAVQVLPVKVELKDKVKVATVIEQKEPAAPAPAPGGAKNGK